MRKERKEALMYAFPPVPAKCETQMRDGQGYANFCVFLTNGHELFVRCFHRYSRKTDCPIEGRLIERQRYVFAKDGCVRYIYDTWTDRWRPATKFREPRFADPAYPYSFDNSYCILNANALKESDMRYCSIHCHRLFPMQYMRFFVRHPNIEYLEKAGYDHLIIEKEYIHSYWENAEYVGVDEHVDLKTNNLLKMLHLNRTEFKLLQGRENAYLSYLQYREVFPKAKPEDLINIAYAYGSAYQSAKKHAEATGLSILRLTRYLSENNIDHRLYNDYLDQCIQLGYDLNDTAINMPRDFFVMHARMTSLIKAEETKELCEAFQKHYEERSRLEFTYRGLVVRQPNSIQEIADEGSALKHCVGGYAERHAKGQVTILFLRQVDQPNIPYYTMEIDKTGKIRQCYGYKNNRANNPKPPEIKTFEKHYEQYLQEVIHGKRNHSAARQSA